MPRAKAARCGPVPTVTRMQRLWGGLDGMRTKTPRRSSSSSTRRASSGAPMSKQTKFAADGTAASPSSAASRAYSWRPATTWATTPATKPGSPSEARAPAWATRLTPKWLRTFSSAWTRPAGAMA